MTDYDDLPFSAGEAPGFVVETPRKCFHRWVNYHNDGRDWTACDRCGHVKDEAASRRGKNNKSRGLSIQRQVAGDLEMEHVPGNRPEDARSPRFVAEIKSGPSWYSTRVEAELDNLPTAGDRTAIFVAASTPGGGRKRRVYVELSLGDLVKLVGPHVQVAMWAPEFVTLKREIEE